MAQNRLNIGIFGTFDVENYGDVLFPIIAEAELTKRLGPVNIYPFSYGKKSSSSWPYEVESLEKLPDSISALDGVLIGGGHLIRFDKFVAPNYFPPTAHIHHPTGYWLTPMLLALQYGIPIAWNAPGALGEVPNWASALMETVIQQSAYVSVRDDWAKEILMNNSPHLNTNVLVTPDTVFSIAEVFPAKRERSDKLSQLFDSLKITRPYILIQTSRGLESFARMFKEHPDTFENYQIIGLPIGPAIEDNISILENELPNIIHFPEWPQALLIAEMIAGAAAVAGTSFHLTITALAYGVPVFRPISDNRKYTLFSEFQNIFYFDNSQPVAPAWVKLCLEDASPSNNHATMKSMVMQTNRHWDRITGLFRNKANLPAPHLALSYLLQSFPILLETPYASQLLKHEAIIDWYKSELLAANSLAQNALQQLQCIQHSTIWRMTASIRGFLGRYPSLCLLGRRILNLFNRR